MSSKKVSKAKKGVKNELTVGGDEEVVEVAVTSEDTVHSLKGKVAESLTLIESLRATVRYTI